jgi:TerC family integral membrane protein
MIFEYFHVPDEYTERVLKWGIMSALVLRGVMIAMGVAAVERFRPVLLLFALILIWSSYKMLQPENDEDLSDNAVMKIARWLVDATDEYDGDAFFTTVKGTRRATPMLVVLVCIELSDVLFAVDSIPAVVGITHDPFIVYSSNIFALMALRSLYLILAKSVQQLLYLRHAVAAILGFVGMKMVAEYFGIHVSSFLSLAVILALLAAGTAASIAHNRRSGAGGSASGHEHVRDVV